LEEIKKEERELERERDRIEIKEKLL